MSFDFETSRAFFSFRSRSSAGDSPAVGTFADASLCVAISKLGGSQLQARVGRKRRRKRGQKRYGGMQQIHQNSSCEDTLSTAARPAETRQERCDPARKQAENRSKPQQKLIFRKLYDFCPTETLYSKHMHQIYKPHSIISSAFDTSLVETRKCPAQILC